MAADKTDKTYEVKGKTDTQAVNLSAPELQNTNIIKTGDGTLEATVSTDTNENNFTGNVDVQKGTMVLKNPADGNIQPNTPKGVIGASEGNGSEPGAIIKVAEGAELVMGAKTGISIPGGNLTNVNPQITNLIEGGANKFSDDGKSHLSNVVIKEASITANNSSDGKKGTIKAEGISLQDHDGNNPINVENIDAKVDQAHLTGSINITNSTLECADVLWMMNFTGSKDVCMKVTNSSIYLQDRKDSSGMLNDVSVDKTSRINVKDVGVVKADKAEKARIYLLGKNDLHVAATTHGGLATVESQPCEHKDHMGEIVTYTSDQLSGCTLFPGGSDMTHDGTNDDATALTVRIDDDLPNLDRYDHFTFNLVLTGLDASAVIQSHLKEETLVDGKTYYFDNDEHIRLQLDEYMTTHGITINDRIGVAHYNSYGDTGKEATVFTFSMEGSVPEPATATLSLLALAGLAARRRRR